MREAAKRYRVELALAASLIAYVILLAVVGRFSGFDEPWYKSAGREWALHGRFASPELTGFFPPGSTGPDEIFFCYPPLYPFTFGLFVKLAGFGWRQCVVFDAVIRAALALLTYVLTRRLAGERLPRWGAMAVSLSLLPIGANNLGRPDDLAMVFGLSAILVALRESKGPGRAILSGAFLGLCAATSVAAATMLGIIVVVIILATTSGSAAKRVLWCTLCGGVAAAVLAVLVAPVLIPHPGAIDQYRNLATAYVGGGGRLHQFFANFKFSRGLMFQSLPFLAAGLWLSTKNLRVGGRIRWITLWLGPLLSLSLLLYAFPVKVTYLWFLTPWLLGATAAELALAWSDLGTPRRSFALIVTIGAIALGAELTVKFYVSLATAPPSQRPEANEAALSALIPPGHSVLTTEAWWFLAGNRTVYDARWACVDSASVDYLVFTGNGSGAPGMPVALDATRCLARFPLDEYEPIEDRLSRHVPTLFGKALTNSAYGFGNLVLKRKPGPTEAHARGATTGAVDALVREP